MRSGWDSRHRAGIRPRQALKLAGLLVGLAGLALALIATPAGAAVAIGQTSPAGEGCEGPADVLQPTVTSGSSYVVPVAGTITSWSHEASASENQLVRMKIFRKLAEPSTYEVVGHDGPRSPVPSSLNTYETSIDVLPGDVLGLTPLTASAGESVACVFDAPGETQLRLFDSDLADGESAAFPESADHRLNASAVAEPDNGFAITKKKRKKQRGTAVLTVDVPNPGELALSGRGVKKAAADRAGTAKTVLAAGSVKLKVKAKGKKKKRLKRTGKVKVKPKLTYTPDFGESNRTSIKLNLKRKRKR